MTAGAHRRPSPFGEGSDGLGYPTAQPPTSGPPPRSPGPAEPGPAQRPGPATAAAVLGFVAAAVQWLLATWLVVGIASYGPGATSLERAVVVVLAVGWTTLSALLAVGSLQLLQRQGRDLLARASRIELVVLALLVVAAWVFLDGYGAAGSMPYLLAGLAVGGVRLVLLSQPAVSTWTASATGPADDGPLRAVLVPHAALLVATLLMWLIRG